LLPGIFLILVGYVGCDFVLANIFLFFALGFNGAALISNLSNNQDLAPNFAGFLYGIMNTVGSTSGMIIPPIVEEIAGKFGVSLQINSSSSLMKVRGSSAASLLIANSISRTQCALMYIKIVVHIDINI